MMLEIPVVAWKRGKGGLHLPHFELRNSLELTFGGTVSVDDNALWLLAVSALVESLETLKEKILDSSCKRKS